MRHHIILLLNYLSVLRSLVRSCTPHLEPRLSLPASKNPRIFTLKGWQWKSCLHCTFFCISAVYSWCNFVWKNQVESRTWSSPVVYLYPSRWQVTCLHQGNHFHLEVIMGTSTNMTRGRNDMSSHKDSHGIIENCRNLSAAIHFFFPDPLVQAENTWGNVCNEPFHSFQQALRQCSRVAFWSVSC